MGVSQPIFADVLNVSTPTVRSSEQGVREPEGPSLRLLEFAERQPAVLLEMAGVPNAVTATAKSSASRLKSAVERRLAVARHK
jgi:hypothetical protein